MIKVLFVCLGNICRSPMAEGIFRDLVEQAGLYNQVVVDSAGTHGYHIGEPPDLRAQDAAARRGIEIATLKGRQVRVQDLRDFDYVLAMDDENLRNLRRFPHGSEAHVRLFLEFATHADTKEVPDPYYGGISGFDRVYDLLEDAARGLLADVRRRLQE
ncbi:MAG TPA: low molecular weight protein-tyrosine-phosphatase [Acidiferrobacter sp.]|nr:low molecular weight protein-tyrosine-phosphatase [Acidiferrobacter sp.]